MTKTKRRPFFHTRKRYRVNRKYKDRLFRQIFHDKKDLLTLYNAINHTSYTDPNVMNLYEHQSTINPNMPLRGVFYFSELYETYIELYELDVYGTKLIPLPLPQFVVFYNGEKDAPDRVDLKLSDAFVIPESNVAYTPALECTATMLNINAGHNQEILDNCKPLRDYSIFVSKVAVTKQKVFRRNRRWTVP